MSSCGGDLDLHTSPSHSLSLAFVQNSPSDVLPLYHSKQTWRQLFLTSYISYFTFRYAWWVEICEFFQGWYLTNPICSVSSWKSLHNHCHLNGRKPTCTQHVKACEAVHMLEMLGIVDCLFSHSAFSSCCPDMNWHSGRRKISLAVIINNGSNFKAYFSRPNAGNRFCPSSWGV